MFASNLEEGLEESDVTMKRLLVAALSAGLALAVNAKPDDQAKAEKNVENVEKRMDNFRKRIDAGIGGETLTGDEATKLDTECYAIAEKHNAEGRTGGSGKAPK